MKQPENEKIRYFLYCRKSTEDEDRQMQSNEDQNEAMVKMAKKLNLEILEILTESKSAKSPHNRPIYSEMIKRIYAGEANGLLLWSLSRASRNAFESGELQQMLQDGIIKSIITSDREYKSDDNVIMFSVESSVNNQYIIDLRKAVKRGIEGRIRRGWHANVAPLCYLNVKQISEEHTVEIDPERFDMGRKMWDMMLTGQYTPPKILEIATNEWGFRTRKRKKTGGKPLSRAGIYRFFTNIFYAGMILHNGEYTQGNHQPMVTLEEFDKVQFLLGRKGKPRPKTHSFTFTGFLRCAECGCMLTGEVKQKLIKSTGEVKSYTYYHCTHKRQDYKCSQRKSMTEEQMVYLFEKEIKKFTIHPQLREWALEVLEENHTKEIAERNTIYEAQLQTKKDIECQRDNLIPMRVKDMITDEEFNKEKQRLNKELAHIDKAIKETEERGKRWFVTAEKVFNFATYARANFLKGDLQTKKEILMILGQNPKVEYGKLTIGETKWLVSIENDFPPIEEKYLELEKMVPADRKANINAYGDLSLQLRRG